MINQEQKTILKKAICNLNSLPAMPIIAQKILVLNLESEEGEKSMLKLIEKDPQISAKIIGLANTPLFGSSKRISSVSEAAMRLGLTRVKAVTMGIAVMSVLVKKPEGKLNAQALWLHSLGISLVIKTIAKEMPKHTRPLEDEILLAGLLHDIGYMVLNQLDQKASDMLHAFLSEHKEEKRPLIEIENELLEMNHAEIGAELARIWELPENIISIIRYHHTPHDTNVESRIGQPLSSMINLAEKLLPTFGNIETEELVCDEDWEVLGINPEKAEEIREVIAQQVEELKSSGSHFAF